MDEVVSARLSGELLRRIDRLVSEGRFRSRSEALRVIVKGYLDERNEFLVRESLEAMLRGAPDLTDEELKQLGPILFKSRVAELVAEGRGGGKGLTSTRG